MTKNILILAGAAMLIGGCAMTTPPQSSQPSYFALGTEPFWNLEITTTQLRFHGLDLEPLAVANPGVRTTAEGRFYRTRLMQVAIRPGSCSDGMSDREYVESVSVNVHGRTFHGCGGSELRSETGALDRSEWTITAVNGAPAPTNVRTSISFAEGRVSGTVGCNRLNGPYTQERNLLRFGAIAMTRMACAGPGGEQERVVSGIMAQQPLTIRFGERMTMRWTAPDGSSIDWRRLDWD